MATSNKKLLGAKGISTSSKDATNVAFLLLFAQSLANISSHTCHDVISCIYPLLALPKHPKTRCFVRVTVLCSRRTHVGVKDMSITLRKPGDEEKQKRTVQDHISNELKLGSSKQSV